jgi:hypothetical protein
MHTARNFNCMFLFGDHSRGAALVFVATFAVSLSVIPMVGCGGGAGEATSTHPLAQPNARARTMSMNGAIDTSNPFFQSLGTNGRACVSCHQPDEGWTVTPPQIQVRFDATDGLDPIFRPVDGANAPDVDVSTVEARRAAYSMLLTKGLIRVGIGLPQGAEFELVSVDDPYGYASATELSLFRRPLPATNLAFLSGVMWDGRETFKGQSIDFDLADQANSATLGHAQAAQPLTEKQRQQIVDFETALFTTQAEDPRAGDLTAAGALGGPEVLSQQSFFLGINDPLGQNPTNASFTSTVFTIFDAWARPRQGADEVIAARQSIARGQALFNSKAIAIEGVKGLNDDLNQEVIMGTCGTCHDAPNVGNHSLPVPLDIGIAEGSKRTADMPLYTLRSLSTGETVQVTDPGRALITGKWKDVGRFKGPVLRDLAARAPYFHNGMAATLTDVAKFYNDRFTIGLTPDEQTDLVNFLNAL